MKKNLFYTLFCLCLNANLFAQELNKDLEESQEDAFVKRAEKASKIAIKSKNITIYEDFFKENQAPTKKMRAWVNLSMAYALWQINEKELKKDITSPNSIRLVKKILDNYQLAIDSCEYCSITNRLERYDFLETFDLVPEIRKSELAIMKAAGYREFKMGISLGANVSRGKDTWVGGQLGFFSFNEPKFKIKSLDAETGKLETIRKVKRTTTGHLMAIAFNMNIERKTTEFAASIFQMSAPIMVDVTKFGYRNIGEGKRGTVFYRPEIGVGLGAFSISYGYNHLFNKAYRPLYERHLLNLRFTPIVIKTK